MLKVIQITQPSSFQVELTNVPTDASNAANKEAGWALSIYSAGSTLGNTMTTTGSNLLRGEAYDSTGGNLTYRVTLPVGWYVLAADTPTTTTQVAAIGLQYFNFPFNCHFDNTWNDDFTTYSGCTQASPVPTTPTGFETSTNLPGDKSFTFTTNFSNTALPYLHPRFSLGSLVEGTYLSIEIAHPSYTAGSTAISLLGVFLYRNSGTESLNLSPIYCAGETS